MPHLLVLTKLRILDRYLMYVTFPVIAIMPKRVKIYPFSCDSNIIAYKPTKFIRYYRDSYFISYFIIAKSC